MELWRDELAASWRRLRRAEPGSAGTAALRLSRGCRPTLGRPDGHPRALLVTVSRARSMTAPGQNQLALGRDLPPRSVSGSHHEACWEGNETRAEQPDARHKQRDPAQTAPWGPGRATDEDGC